MSFDLVVFDPSRAPLDKSSFLDWYDQQSEESEEISEASSPALRSFFLEIIQRYPPLNGPLATKDIDNPKVTDYAIGPSSIYMCFAWSQAAEAYGDVIELSREQSVGFYNISDPEGQIWLPPQILGEQPLDRPWWKFWQ